MHIKSVKYTENRSNKSYWELDQLDLGLKTLIVGRNSTGKSRTLSVIHSLARNLSIPGRLPISAEYDITFTSSDRKEYKYLIEFKDSRVTKEKLSIDEKVYLDRGEEGSGTIWAEKIGNGVEIPFQAPTEEVALFKKMDLIQHSFIAPLFQWASSTRMYNFGSSLGKDHLMLFIPNGPAVDERDQNQVTGIFRNGIREFGDAFKSSIIRDMAKVGYFLDDVAIGLPTSIIVENAPGEISSLIVKESGLSCNVDQIGMSQGMYRVLALLIHMNFLQMKGIQTSVVVDDIGEGLDFERSCKIINVLRSKSDESGIQVIMSTNDRFVMNEVPLKEWTVLHRNGSKVSVSNYGNSAEKFDQFRFTGLSNFSFFEMDYLEDIKSEDDDA